jgi:hypothetical protein
MRYARSRPPTHANALVEKYSMLSGNKGEVDHLSRAENIHRLGPGWKPSLVKQVVNLASER